MIQAIWPKSPDYLEEVKSLVKTLVVQTQTILSCEASPSKIELEDRVVVSDALSPALEGASIILKYHTPEDSIIDRAMVTLSTVAFRDEYTPTVTGAWSVQATWKGNANYLKSSFQIATFNVEEKAQPTYTSTPTPTMMPPPTPTPTHTSTLTPSPPPTPTRTPSPTPSLISTPTPTPNPTPTSKQKENNGLDQIPIMLITLLGAIIFLWVTIKIILKRQSS